MKHIVSIAAALLAWWGAAAQPADSVSLRKGGSLNMEWMQPFGGVTVDGPMRVVLTRVGEDEPTKIAYDTRSSLDSRVKASVDKYGILTLREKNAREKIDTTEVRVYYHTLESLSADGARVSFTEPVTEPMLDLAVSGGACVEAELDVRDLVLNVTGKSEVVLKGRARYLTLTVSTARVDASALQPLSTRVDASHGARVNVWADERLEAYAASAKIQFGGKPEIVRAETSTFGGEIVEAGPEAEIHIR